IFLWDMDSWQVRGTLAGHPPGGDVSWLAFSPDGTTLASVTTGPDTCCVRLWDVATATRARTLGGARSGMWGVDWSSDGTRVTCPGWDRTVRIWDVASGEERPGIADAGGKFVRALAFSPKGDMIVTGGIGPTRLWDAKTGRQITEALPPDMCPSFFPAGDRV